MNAIELGALLGEVSQVDGRTVDEAALLAWMPLIGDLDYMTAVEAARLHHRESDFRIKPNHIRANVERILLAGLGAREDEYGNQIEADGPALAAWQRLHQQKGISS